MCSMSMLCPLACAGARNCRRAAAKPAPRPKVFLKKSRLFFMALPLQRLTDPTVARNSMDIGSKGNAQLGPRHRSATAVPERKGRTQMRRMLKEAVYAGGEYGGLLSELHAPAGSAAANSTVVSRTTVPLSTT